jgi:hypothetical protein
MILSSGRVEDRVAVIAAIEDAVAVAVVADAMKPDDAWALAGPGMQLLGVPPTDLPSAAQLEPTALADGEDASRTKRADGTADDGDAGLAAELEAEEEARASLRQRRAAVFVIVAAIAVPAALTLDIGLIGLVLVVLALALLAWLFA